MNDCSLAFSLNEAAYLTYELWEPAAGAEGIPLDSRLRAYLASNTPGVAGIVWGFNEEDLVAKVRSLPDDRQSWIESVIQNGRETLSADDMKNLWHLVSNWKTAKDTLESRGS